MVFLHKVMFMLTKSSSLQTFSVTLYCVLMYNHYCWYVQFKPEMVDLVYNCAKFKYECGNYTEASEYLYFYRVLVSVCHCVKCGLKLLTLWFYTTFLWELGGAMNRFVLHCMHLWALATYSLVLQNLGIWGSDG